MKEVRHNCPYCDAALKSWDVDRPILVRCPIVLVEGDRARWPEEVAYVCEQLGVEVLPYTKKCGKLFLRYPSR